MVYPVLSRTRLPGEGSANENLLCPHAPTQPALMRAVLPTFVPLKNMKVTVSRPGFFGAVVAAILFGQAQSGRAVNLVQEFYLPMPEAQIRLACTAVEATGVGTNFESISSIVVTGDGTVI